MSGRLATRNAAAKLAHNAKWEVLARKLNSVESGALKNETKWQQYLRDFKNNIKRKGSKGENSQKFSNLELRLMALYNEDTPETKPIGIDISCVTEIDPLSSDDNNSCDNLLPEVFSTYTCQLKTERPSPLPEPDGNEYKIKRKRVQVLSEDFLNQQNKLISQLTSLESLRQELDDRQASVLEALTAAVDRQAAAITRAAAAAEVQTEVMTRMLEFMKKMDTKKMNK